MVSKQEIDNSLEYFRLHYLTSPWNAAMYVLSKSMLGTTINNPQDIIDYFNNTQQEDGSWQTSPTERLYPTQRTLIAYFILNARPASPMAAFFSKYNTIEKVHWYIENVTHSDGRDVYHIIYPWCVYYWRYPPWLDQFFAETEQNLSWTIEEDFHEITHKLYSYVIARRQFPNLDAMITNVISRQLPDGSWIYVNRPVYSTSICISLFAEILKLYPGVRTADIAASMQKAVPYIESSYQTQVLEGKVCGYFGTTDIEDGILAGILCAGQTGIIGANIDMTFEDIVQRIRHPSAIPLLLLVLGTGVLGYYLAKT